jgi:hypothetical protein
MIGATREVFLNIGRFLFAVVRALVWFASSDCGDVYQLCLIPSKGIEREMAIIDQRHLDRSHASSSVGARPSSAAPLEQNQLD